MPRVTVGNLSDIPQPNRGGGGDFIRSIYLKNDGEECRLAFLTDQFFYGYFHTVEREGGGFGGFRICLKEESGQDCNVCERDEMRVEEGLKRKNWPRLMFLTWAFEMTHFYTDEPKRLEYEVTSIGSRELYVVTVDEVRLMRYSAGQLTSSGIQRQADLKGTLVGREFSWVRNGQGLDTGYLLESGDPLDAGLKKKLAALADSLPDLEDVAFGVVESLGSDDDEEKPVKKFSGVVRSGPEEEETGKGFDELTSSLEEDGDDEPW